MCGPHAGKCRKALVELYVRESRSVKRELVGLEDRLEIVDAAVLISEHHSIA
jgi:hypothetical protein